MLKHLDRKGRVKKAGQASLKILYFTLTFSLLLQYTIHSLTGFISVYNKMNFLQNIFDKISLTKDISLWENSEDSDEANIRRLELLASYTECEFKQFLTLSTSPGRKNALLSEALLKKSQSLETNANMKLIRQAVMFAPPGSCLDSVLRLRCSRWEELGHFQYALTDLSQIQNKEKEDEERMGSLKTRINNEKRRETRTNHTSELKSPNPALLNFSCGVRLGTNKKDGRFVLADKLIQPGELIADEMSFVALLDRKYGGTHCDFCLTYSDYILPCYGCASVVFCSAECRDKATFHTSECLLLDQIFKAETGVWHLALRIVAAQPITYWSTQPYLNNPEFLSSNNISTVYNLVTHKGAGEIDAPVLMKESLTALFFLRVLKSTGYLNPDISTSQTLSRLDKKIGILILHFMRVTFFNSHEVTELANGSVYKIGCCLNPSLALVNHSCDPNYARIVIGRRSLAFATRPIQKDEEICDVYSPTFLMVDRLTRHETTERYNFVCGCTACTENWPMEHKMSSNCVSLLPNDNTAELEKEIKCMLNQNWQNKFAMEEAIAKVGKTIYKSHLRLKHPCKPVLKLEILLHQLLWEQHYKKL